MNSLAAVELVKLHLNLKSSKKGLSSLFILKRGSKCISLSSEVYITFADLSLLTNQNAAFIIGIRYTFLYTMKQVITMY